MTQCLGLPSIFTNRRARNKGEIIMFKMMDIYRYTLQLKEPVVCLLILEHVCHTWLCMATVL